MIGYRFNLAVAKAAVRLLKASGFLNSYFGHWRGEFFDYAQCHGIHILPVHYYSPVPVARAAADKPVDFPVSLEAAVATVHTLLERYDAELEAIFSKPDKTQHDYDPANHGFAPADAGVLYGMIRSQKPARIIEIGSGMSTLIAAAAISAAQAEDPAYLPKFTCIEPYLPRYLNPKPAGVTEVLEQALQAVPLEYFEQLQPGDMLFIDSTHVVNYGSDVVYEFLSILPRLARGVNVHVHDIFFPYDYPGVWIERDRFFWNEQYLLHAILAFSGDISVTAAVHAAYREAGAELSPSLAKHASAVIPGSFWFTRTD